MDLPTFSKIAPVAKYYATRDTSDYILKNIYGK
jgi:hypothetical protein